MNSTERKFVVLYEFKTETTNAGKVSFSVFSNINCIIYLLII